MIIYILRKIFTFLFILFLLSQLSFSVAYFSAQSIYSQTPFFHAYIDYFGQLLTGSLVLNPNDPKSFLTAIQQILPPTIELCVLALLLSLLLGVILGIVAGLNPDSRSSHIIQAASLIIGACPLVWLSVLIIYVFSDNNFLLPQHGSLIEQTHPVTGFALIDIFLSADVNHSRELLKELQYLALPVLILAIHPCIVTIQLVSERINDVAKQNYIKTLVIRERSQWKILLRHMLPNVFPAIAPRLTHNFTILLFSTLIIEIIFNRPGLGRAMMYAFMEQNSLAIAVAILLCGFLLSALNLLSEFITILIHPLRHKELYDE